MTRSAVSRIALTLALAGIAVCAAAQQTYPKVSNSFFNTDIRQALSDTASEVGVTMLMDEGVSGFISLDLNDVPLDRALKLMLMPLGLVYKEVEPGVFLVASPDPKSPSFHLISESRVISLAFVDPANLLKLLPDRWVQYVRTDVDSRKAVVEAPTGLMDDIVAYIKKLDTAPKQIMIEAVVIEAASQALRQYNLNFASPHLAGDIAGGILNYAGIPLANANQGLLGALNPNGPYPMDNTLLGLSWILQNDEGALRANPRIVARDGKEAEIEVGTEEYFSLLTGSAVYAYTRLEKVSATIKLSINPRVIEDTGEILCDIEPSVSDVTGNGLQGLPVITIRRAKSSIRVKDGQAIIIGGLLEELKQVTENKVPILGDLPLIGKLFRSKDSTKVQKEVIIIIAPHLLDDAGNLSGPLLSTILMDQPASTLADLAQDKRDRAPRPKQPAPKPEPPPSVSPLERSFMKGNG